MAQPAAANSLAVSGPSPDGPFSIWLEEFFEDAEGRGFSREFLGRALTDIEPIARVVELDRRQPEFTQTFWTYLDRRVSDARIREGRRLLKENASLLRQIEKKYGVQGRFLVAFWGLETNFGEFLGGFPVINALVTLAYDDRRSAFFRAELLDALTVLRDGHIDQNAMVGSWAGAMGQPQFMPSTFVAYAIDENGDGRKDIWATLPDVFGSAANYLSQLGWDAGYTWGREVRVPDNFELEQASLRIKKPLSDWQALGVRRIDGTDLPSVGIDGAVILPAGIRGPAFLVYENFNAILTWNRSLLYAVSVGHFADRLIGLGPLRSVRNEETPLSRDQVKELQAWLNALGHDSGEPDGQAGPRTRAAVKDFQSAHKLPADGHPDGALYEAVKASLRGP